MRYVNRSMGIAAGRRSTALAVAIALSSSGCADAPSAWQAWAGAVGLVLAGAIVALVLFLRRRRAEAAVWRDTVRIAEYTRAAAVGELAGWVAEQVGEPITSLLNNVGAALRLLEHGREAPPDAIAAVDEARAAGERATHAIRRMQLLVFGAEGARHTVDLNELAREAVRLLQRHAATHHVAVVASLYPRLPGVLGDEVQLSRVVVSLVLSAVDAASTSAGRTVEVKTALSENGIELEVADSGPALSERDRPEIFAPFSRVRGGNFGIGLALTRSIVEGHGGRITAERPERGALFRVHLPAEVAAGSLRVVG